MGTGSGRKTVSYTHLTNQKENDFIIQNGKLSPAALKRKTELENNPDVYKRQSLYLVI